ncbi:ABC transporter permease [candidate division KSB1 bacterium]
MKKGSVPAPPRFAEKLLRILIHTGNRQYLLGDMEEVYPQVINERGKMYALLWYWYQAVIPLPDFIITHIYWSFAMFNNYLKIALRNIARQKVFSFINIAGLAVGITCCLLILLYVQDELSYDTFHEKNNRIWRTTIEWFNSDGTTSLYLGHIAPPYKEHLVNTFPEIEQAVRIRSVGGALFQYEDKSFLEERVFFAEENVFDFFTFPMVHGDPATALTKPMDIVITESAAYKYFGESDPMNKSFQVDFYGTKVNLKVSGVTEDVPENSHWHYDFLISFKTYEMFAPDLESYSSNNYATYLLLPENYDIGKLSAEMPGFIDGLLGEDAHLGRILRFQKMTDIHLHSHLDSEIEANSDIKYVYIFSAIALFVLIIACINFMNLATARSAGRAHEVGLRKVVGAERRQIIGQFLGETTLLALFAMLLSIVLVIISLPAFRNFTGKSLTFGFADSLFILSSLLGIVIFVGIAAGSYPAFFLSSFQPVKVLRGKLRAGAGASGFRTVLVVKQFAISIILIISVVVVYEQLHYVRNARLGFDKEHVVFLGIDPSMTEQYETIRERLIQHPGILDAAGSSRVPSGRLLDSGGARIYKEGTLERVQFRIADIKVSHDYIPTYKIEMAAGRNFSREFSTDPTEAFILNETAVNRLGWSAEEAVDQPMNYGGREGRIIGVMKDFHFESMHQPITPIIFYLSQGDFNAFSARLAPGEIQSALDHIMTIWNEYKPGYPFQFFFVDENFDEQYQAEEKLGNIFGIFSMLAIVIACLGLFGLASYTAERRTKEIGIRKVLGASTSGIVGMLTKEFAILVVVANFIAWPVAYYAINKWLMEFAYRVELGWVWFAVASLIALFIAAATVSFQAVKAAIADPVQSISYE